MGLNRSRFLTRVAVAGAIACVAPTSMAEDTASNATTPPAAPAKAGKPMKMDAPMAGEMKKEGMMKGDMKKAAEKKQRDMKEAMEKEEKAMKGGRGDSK